MSHSPSKTSTPSSPACEPAALSSSASWSATRTATGSATSAAPRGSSSSWQSRSADGSGPPPTPDQPSDPTGVPEAHPLPATRRSPAGSHSGRRSRDTRTATQRACLLRLQLLPAEITDGPLPTASLGRLSGPNEPTPRWSTFRPAKPDHFSTGLDTWHAATPRGACSRRSVRRSEGPIGPPLPQRKPATARFSRCRVAVSGLPAVPNGSQTGIPKPSWPVDCSRAASVRVTVGHRSRRAPGSIPLPSAFPSRGREKR